MKGFQGSRHVVVYRSSDLCGLLAQVARMPRLTSLGLRGSRPRELLGGPPCPQIRKVHLNVLNDVGDCRLLPQVFPSLEALSLNLLARPELSREERKDLRTLSGVAVTVNGRPL